MRDGPAEQHVGRSVGVSGGFWGTVGTLLGPVSSAVARLRRAKPLHPVGAVLPGRLVRDGVATSGSAWIDGAGDDAVVVRLSRAAGLPLALPDVHGLAFRHSGSDVLLSTAGAATGTRHVLAPRLAPGRTPYTSLVPFHGPRGPVMLGALPEGRSLPRDPAGWAAVLEREPWHLVLVWATTTGSWQRFGHLEVGGAPGSRLDPPLRFEPLAAPAGLETYAWVRRLREPAYAAARVAYPEAWTPDPEPAAHDRTDNPTTV